MSGSIGSGKETVDSIIDSVSGLFLQRNRRSQIHEDELAECFIFPCNAWLYCIVDFSRSST
jgi:hypothetical protein